MSKSTLVPQFEIEPLVGVGPVKLGMTREEVSAALSPYPDCGFQQSEREKSHHAFRNSLEIVFGGRSVVTVLSVSWHLDCGCEYLFRGQHISSYSAQALFQALSVLDHDEEHGFDPDSFDFSNIMVRVWNADPQYDYLGGESQPVYAQVSVYSVVAVQESHRSLLERFQDLQNQNAILKAKNHVLEKKLDQLELEYLALDEKFEKGRDKCSEE